MALKEKKPMWPADRIKALRKAYGEKQDEFCTRLGVSVWALRDWEQGRSEPIGPAQLLLSRLEEDLDAGKPRKLVPA